MEMGELRGASQPADLPAPVGDVGGPPGLMAPTAFLEFNLSHDSHL